MLLALGPLQLLYQKSKTTNEAHQKATPRHGKSHDGHGLVLGPRLCTRGVRVPCVSGERLGGFHTDTPRWEKWGKLSLLGRSAYPAGCRILAEYGGFFCSPLAIARGQGWKAAGCSNGSAAGLCARAR